MASLPEKLLTRRIKNENQQSKATVKVQKLHIKKIKKKTRNALLPLINERNNGTHATGSSADLGSKERNKPRTFRVPPNDQHFTRSKDSPNGNNYNLNQSTSYIALNQTISPSIDSLPEVVPEHSQRYPMKSRFRNLPLHFTNQ